MLDHDEIRLSHILEAALEAQSFLSGKSKDDFFSDRMLSHAVIRSLEILGEAATKVSKDYRDKYPDIPWQAMISMRNFLIHTYMDINYNLVWNTLQEDVPKLIYQLQNILGEKPLL